MTHHSWSWSEIVSPELVEKSLTRAARRKRSVFAKANDDGDHPFVGKHHPQPVAA